MLTGLIKFNLSANEVFLEITHSSYYEFSVTVNGRGEMSSFYGRYIATLVNPPEEEWTISVWAKKMGANTAPLSIELKLKDGTVLGFKSTYEPFGEVDLSVVIY